MAEEKRRFPWLSSGDRLILVIAFTALIALLGLHYAFATGFARAQPELVRGAALENQRIDINKAQWWEFQALRGIGEKKGKDIVRHRSEHGDFKSVDDLTDVHGIGKKTIRRLRPYLTGGEREEADEKRP